MVEGEQRRSKRIMVFCNTLDSCRAVEHHLRERGTPTGERSCHSAGFRCAVL